MKYIITGLALFAASTVARPSEIDYTPKGGWESVDYPEPEGGWENVDYPEGTGANLPPGSYNGGAAAGGECTNGPFKFTSTYHVVATPDQVVNGTTNPVATGGLPGAIGYYDFGINTDLDLICYNIRLVGFRGDYSSPADTATHIHEAAKGKNGPPRIAFPNPEPKGDERISVGCLKAPFKTGLPDNSTGAADSGDGFSVSQIEANPAGFFSDVHSSLAIPGAVRGQLA